MLQIDSKQKVLKHWSFIDLFAGIGGFHYALKSFGAECVFSSEINEKAADIYELNHGFRPSGDITKIREKDIPEHDILCAGFPCQAFSVSGKQKGFEDTRGTLFFDIARIVEYHKPKIIFLENVKNFASHDKGNTLAVVSKTLVNLGYSMHFKVLNTSNFGLPQNRERLYIVALNADYFDNSDFNFPDFVIKSKLENFLQGGIPEGAKIIERDDIDYYKEYIPELNSFGVSLAPNRPIQIAKIAKGRQGERVYHIDGHAITLSAYGGGIGSKTGIYKVGEILRKLSPRECARIQGFPESFKPHESVSEAHKQFGNSVSINVLQYIMKSIIETIKINQ